jgi:hypothetical protein
MYRMCHLKRNPTTIMYNGTKIKSEAGPPPCNRLSQPHRDTRVKVTLVARPLLTQGAQKLCTWERGVFTNRTCIHSRASLRNGLVCCCSWNNYQFVSWQGRTREDSNTPTANKISGHRKCLSVTSPHRATKQLKLWPCRFQAVHQMQQRGTTAKI